MINYKKCSEVNLSLLYDAFEIGFSDYIIKVEMPKEIFINRFFVTEGNSLQQSFIALDEDKPVGIVLGGIKEYEGIKTMRCGSLAVAPEYRGKGIGEKLMELHKEEALKQQCKQLFLEVIVENHKAIKFYGKLGYQKIFDLNYFSLNEVNNLKDFNSIQLNIEEASLENLSLVRNKLKDVHINWQNDIEYIEKSQGQSTFGAYINEKIAGIISINKNGRINFIWVENALRLNKIGTSLILKACEVLNLDKVSISFPNNASIQGFINRIKFKKDSISQYEMYLTLK